VIQTPLPGDFAVVPTTGDVGTLIRIGERLDGAPAKFAQYQHAFIYVGSGNIVQAEPGGAQLTRLPGRFKNGVPGVMWSTGLFNLGFTIRYDLCATAHGTVGTPYSALDYFALATHHWGIPTPGLQRFIATSRHMICSQLVDYCYATSGVHLFTDGRWPGYVTPADLAQVLWTKRDGQ
jgi:hypothetical protein